MEKIVNYLKLDRAENELRQAIDDVTLTILDGSNEFESNLLTVSIDEFYDGNTWIPLRPNLLPHDQNIVYSDTTGSESEFYYKLNNRYYPLGRSIGQNRNNDDFEEIDITGYEEVFINQNTQVLAAKSDLPPAIISKDTVFYDPSALLAYKTGDSLDLDYIDDAGTAASDLQTADRSQMRKVNIVALSDKAGVIYQLPQIIYENSRYSLKYTIKEVGNDVLPFNYKFSRPAVKLTFNSVGAFLEFVKQTILYSDRFEDFKAYRKRDRQFLDSFVSQMRAEFRNSKYDQQRLLSLLYYLPPRLIIEQAETCDLWDAVETAASYALLNTRTLSKEDIVLQLLRLMPQKYRLPAAFLEDLATRRIKGKEILLKELLYRLDGDNFQVFLKWIWQLWSRSLYAEFGNENPVMNKESPVFLPYKTENKGGFIDINAEVEYDDRSNSIQVEIPTGAYKTVTVKDIDRHSSPEQKREAIIATYDYHPMAPVAFLNKDNPEFAFEKSKARFSVLPAFILYANDESADVENAIIFGEYALDVASIATGVGNIYKFRHLLKLSKLKQALRIGKIARVAGAATVNLIEISSGSLNLMIKLAELEEEPWAQDLQEVLFWLEVASLSGEISTAVAKRLRESGKKTIQNVDRIESSALVRNLDELEQEKFYRQLYRFAEEAGDYSSRVARRVSKSVDNAPKNIIDKEISIAKLKYEDGMVYNPKSKRSYDHAGIKVSNSITSNNVPLSEIEGSIVTHNHPLGSGLSLGDFLYFLDMKPKEVRAVTSDGSVYSLKNKNLSNVNRDKLLKTFKNVAREIDATYPYVKDDYLQSLKFKRLFKLIENDVEYLKYEL